MYKGQAMTNIFWEQLGWNKEFTPDHIKYVWTFYNIVNLNDIRVNDTISVYIQ